MKIKSLFSSSDGNACLVVTDEESILIDAGVSWKQIQGTGGEALDKLTAIFVSHEHSDHVLGAGIAARKSGATIYIPKASHEKRAELFKNTKIVYINGGDVIDLKSLSIKAFSTRHDSIESVGFVITDKSNQTAFGYLTDTGSISLVIRESLKNCDALLIEADYDPQLLEDYDEYDPLLKDRIKCPYGHLGNDQAVDFINSLKLDSIQWILFGHMSRQTNSRDAINTIISHKIKEEYWAKFKFAPNTEFLEIQCITH